VTGKRWIPIARELLFKSDGIGTHHPRPTRGQPMSPGLTDSRDTSFSTQVCRALTPSSAPARTHEDHVSRPEWSFLSSDRRFEVMRRDLVARLAGIDDQGGWNIEENTSAYYRLDVLSATTHEVTTSLFVGGIESAVEATVVRDMRKRVYMGSDVGAHDDKVVGR